MEVGPAGGLGLPENEGILPHALKMKLSPNVKIFDIGVWSPTPSFVPQLTSNPGFFCGGAPAERVKIRVCVQNWLREAPVQILHGSHHQFL